MNFYNEGKLAQKKFKNNGIGSVFEKDVINGILKDKYVHNASDFIKGMIDNSSNQKMYTYATIIAESYKGNTALWSLIIASFNRLIKGAKKPQWAGDFVYKLIQHSGLNLLNYNAHLLITMILTFDDSYDTNYLEMMETRPWFENLKPYVATAIIDNIQKISSSHINSALKVIRDRTFYMDILEKSNDSNVFAAVILKFRYFNSDIDGFRGSFDIIKILKTYKSKLLNNKDAMTFISDMIVSYTSIEAISLWVNLLMQCDFNESNKIMLLKKLESLKSDEIYGALFELTKEEKYLPLVAKDIFLF